MRERPAEGTAVVQREGPASPRKRFRIAVVAACPLPYPRGTPVRIAKMSEALARRGHEVHMVTYHLGDGQLSDDIHIHRIPRIPTYRKLSPGPTYQKLLVVDPLLARELRRVLRLHSIDLIHAHHYEGLLVAMAARHGSFPPLVYDAHTLLGLELPYYPLWLHKGLLGRIGGWLDRRLPGRADHVIAVTEAIEEYLVSRAGLPPNDVTVVGNGVDWRAFDPTPPVGSAGSTDPGAVIFAGNLAPYQGIEVLLKAAAFLRDQGDPVRLVLVTEFEDRLPRSQADLARSLSLHDHLQVVCSDFGRLPTYLRQARVLVNPRPASKGLPLKLLNYMASGRPIVSFEDSAPGLVHGETAWLVPGKDPVDLARGIHHLLRDPELASRLGAAARETAMVLFSWDALAQKVERVYDRVAPQ